MYDRLIEDYKPALVGECVGCGLCERVCSSFALMAFRAPNSIVDLVGGYKSIYVGYAADKFLRWRGSSGGVASALALYVLNEKLVDAVLGVSMSDLVATPIWIRSRAGILRMIGSKYVRVPLLKAMRNISSNINRFAVVGLPCHIRALNLLRKIRVDVDEKLNVSIGLFCSRAINQRGLLALLMRTGVKRLDEVLNLDFRGRGWPGFLRIVLKSGREISIPFFNYWRPLYSTYFYTPLSCLFCNDVTNEVSDISLGDPWLPRFIRRENVGLSLIVVRTKKGEEIISNAVDKGYLYVEELDVDSLIESQWRPLLFKKFLLRVRLAMLEGRRDDILSYGSFGYFLSLMHVFNALHSNRERLHNLIVRVSRFLLEAYALTLSRLERFMWVRLINGVKNPRDQ